MNATTKSIRNASCSRSTAGTLHIQTETHAKTVHVHEKVHSMAGLSITSMEVVGADASGNVRTLTTVEASEAQLRYLEQWVGTA